MWCVLILFLLCFDLLSESYCPMFRSDFGFDSIQLLPPPQLLCFPLFQFHLIPPRLPCFGSVSILLNPPSLAILFTSGLVNLGYGLMVVMF